MRYLHYLPLLALTTCTSPVNQTGSTVPGKCQEQAPLIAPQKTDVLFVIDNSGSMAEEQAGIARELPAFVQALTESGGVEQDFHVGVMTTTVYQNSNIGGVADYQEFPTQSGMLQQVPAPLPDGGTTLTNERFISGNDPELLPKFARLIAQGTTGSGQETPFEAARLALAGPLASVPVEQGGTQGFLRDGARLLVVVVSDEEDCSETDRPPQVYLTNTPGVDDCTVQGNKLTSVQTYYDIFSNLKDSTGALRDVIWAAIAPVAQTDKHAELVVVGNQVENADCPTSNGPGYRHHALAQLFNPQLVNLDSICNADYHNSLVRIAGLAAVDQSLEVSNVPDPGLIKVEIQRRLGEIDICTLDNGGIRYQAPEEEHSGLLIFQNQCLRLGDDHSVQVKLLCAG